MTNDKEFKNEYYLQALDYHSKGKAGKISITPTKSLLTQHDLSCAYSPGVAAPSLEIAKDFDNTYKYTNYGNMVAVITNGTAVLGLGDIGAAAAKPVMEGKAVLFKKFADIDAIDIEIDTKNTEEFIKAVQYLGKTFAGINLEDIKAPECFIIEKALNEYMDIPVFHDDQHGTAVIVSAGLINATHLTNKSLSDIRIVVNGAGSAAIACIELLIALGVQQGNIILCDTKGVIYQGRTDGMNSWKAKYATNSTVRTLSEAMIGSDVFLGLSVKGVVSKEMIASMHSEPIIFALANPEPEITPDEIKLVRDDAIIATGRSDYNNQINNVMGFPYIFRGALDVRAKSINLEMKIAASKALAELARKPVPSEVYKAYSNRKMLFGKEYIIPVPFDPRLITTIPIAVAKAAIDSGVARIINLQEKSYKNELDARLNPTSSYMNLLFTRVSGEPKKIIFTEGEEEETIKAAIMIRDEKLGIPILVGRTSKISVALENMQLSHDLKGIEIMNAALNPNLEDYIKNLYARLQRQGFLYRDCARMIKTDRNIFSAAMLMYGDGDVMITGANKSYVDNFAAITKVIPVKNNQRILSYSIMVGNERELLIADNAVSHSPTAQDLADIAIQMSSIAKNMGYVPRVALLSFANFGSARGCEYKSHVSEAVAILNKMDIDFEYEGEISPEVALNMNLREFYPFCRLSGPANILIMPNLYAASIATQLLQVLAGGVFIGPILHGFEKTVQIVPMAATANEIVNIATLATCVG